MKKAKKADLELYRNMREAEPGLLPDFGDILRSRRHDLEMTQGEVAGRAGCSPSTISTLENGPRTFLPRRPLFRGLGQALGLSAEEMLEAAGYLPMEGLSSLQRAS